MDKFLILLTLSALWAPSEAACPTSCQSCSNERVNCAAAGLTQLPVPMHEDTMTIDLSQNGIQTLKNLPDLQKVESFRISMNKIDVLTDDTFSRMPLLMSLDLSMNQISKIRRNAFKELTQLQSLSLNGNKLTAIGKIFSKTPKVQSLRLGNNEITSIDEENFKENTMIRQLDLSNNKISSIHEDAFKSMKMLRYLILSNNPLGTLPEMTIGSNMLSLADFTNCALTKVPRRMPPSLKDFRLSNNLITEIMVEDFENISSLSLLILNNNKIQNVEHRSFGDLKNLQELWLTDNQLVYIPRGLPKNLQKLHMERNQLVELEKMLFKEGSKLRELSLESNKINKVHQESLKEVKKLEMIILQGNKISLIDVGTFKDLPKLKSIKLTDNPIQYIEKGAFEGLDAMTELQMSYVEHGESGTSLLGENFLPSMPNLRTLDLMSSIQLAKEILGVMDAGGFVMEHIETINMQYNELTTLPDGIAKVIPNVKKFYLDGNIFVCDSNLRWLKRWMQSSDVIFMTYEDISCDTPQAVKGLAITEVEDDDFVDIIEKNTATATANEVIPVPAQRENTEARPNNAQRNNGRDNSNRKPEDNVAKPDSNTEAEGRPQNPPPSPSHLSGTRVVIKPRKGANKATEEKEKKRKTAESRAAAKARRKAAREARRLKKEEAKRLRRNRRHKKGSKRNKRNKRRIRQKNCQTDSEGNVTCTKRRRCKVNGENGHVKCPKREKKKDRKDRGEKRNRRT